MWIVLMLLGTARADTLVLDNGAVIEGALASYERGGECRIDVGDGELAGTEVVLPCGRIVRFERDVDGFPVAGPEVVEVPVVAQGQVASDSTPN